MTRGARRRALAGLVAVSLLLPGLAAGKDTGKPEQAAAAAATPSPGGVPHKESPYIKASRERALAPKPEHRPRLQLSVRGAQKPGGR
jgi:hypothetical protein